MIFVKHSWFKKILYHKTFFLIMWFFNLYTIGELDNLNLINIFIIFSEKKIIAQFVNLILIAVYLIINLKIVNNLWTF
jgi:hypothetical protein